MQIGYNVAERWGTWDNIYMRFACLTKINEWMLESKGFSSNVNNEINNWKEKKYLKKNFDNDALASHAIWWTHTHNHATLIKRENYLLTRNVLESVAIESCQNVNLSP